MINRMSPHPVSRICLDAGDRIQQPLQPLSPKPNGHFKPTPTKEALADHLHKASWLILCICTVGGFWVEGLVP